MNRSEINAKLIDELMDLPNQIAAYQVRLMEDSQDLSKAEKSYAVVENEIRKEINDATDANGKKLYSNADARDAAFLSISINHVDLLQNKTELEDIKQKMQRSRIEVERLSNRQRNLRSIAYLFGGVAEEA
jgi:hypothetical protein